MFIEVSLLSFLSSSPKEDVDEDEGAVEVTASVSSDCVMFIEVALLSVSTNCRKDKDEDEGAVEVTVSVSSDCVMFTEVSLLSSLSSSTNCPEDVDEDEGAGDVNILILVVGDEDANEKKEDEDAVGDAATVLSD
jgi:hypothetical protein